MHREDEPHPSVEPKSDEQRGHEGAKARREIEKVPEPNTDPLHEGP